MGIKHTKGSKEDPAESSLIDEIGSNIQDGIQDRFRWFTRNNKCFSWNWVFLSMFKSNNRTRLVLIPVCQTGSSIVINWLVLKRFIAFVLAWFVSIGYLCSWWLVFAIHEIHVHQFKMDFGESSLSLWLHSSLPHFSSRQVCQKWLFFIRSYFSTIYNCLVCVRFDCWFYLHFGPVGFIHRLCVQFEWKLGRKDGRCKWW